MRNERLKESCSSTATRDLRRDAPDASSTAEGLFFSG
ncbi:hypothetical protein A2U01_0087778, partial [Trifolium medium]|nr:hypothetical protein [Trifolium medium]